MKSEPKHDPGPLRSALIADFRKRANKNKACAELVAEGVVMAVLAFISEVTARALMVRFRVTITPLPSAEDQAAALYHLEQARAIYRKVWEA